MCSIGQFEKLWRVLEYGSAAQVDKILTNKEVINSIQEGFKVYKTTGGSPSIKRIEDEKDLSSVDKLTIIRLSALLNLDEHQSKQIVKSFDKAKGWCHIFSIFVSFSPFFCRKYFLSFFLQRSSQIQMAFWTVTGG